MDNTNPAWLNALIAGVVSAPAIITASRAPAGTLGVTAGPGQMGVYPTNPAASAASSMVLPLVLGLGVLLVVVFVLKK